MVPIMYEWGEVKTVPGNKIAITIYPWTVWDKHTYVEKMTRKGRTKAIYKRTFVSKQSLLPLQWFFSIPRFTQNVEVWLRTFWVSWSVNFINLIPLNKDISFFEAFEGLSFPNMISRTQILPTLKSCFMIWTACC